MLSAAVVASHGFPVPASPVFIHRRSGFSARMGRGAWLRRSGLPREGPREPTRGRSPAGSRGPLAIADGEATKSPCFRAQILHSSGPLLHCPSAVEAQGHRQAKSRIRQGVPETDCPVFGPRGPTRLPHAFSEEQRRRPGHRTTAFSLTRGGARPPTAHLRRDSCARREPSTPENRNYPRTRTSGTVSGGAPRCVSPGW